MSNEDDIGIYNFHVFRRGDTFPARDIAKTEQPAGTPKAIASARMEVRTKKGSLVHAWDTTDNTITITGAGNNIVTLSKVDKAITETWLPGDHDYDLEVVWVAGDNLTILKGIFPVGKDITLPKT